MVDEKKVSLMTKLEIYERQQQNKSIPMSRFYKTDYVRYNVLKTIVAATIAYWLVVGIYIFMQFEDILEKLNEIDYFDLVYRVLITYVMFCVAYFFFATIVYYVRYELARPGLTEYNSNLRDLIELQGGPAHHRKKIKGKVVKTQMLDDELPVAAPTNNSARGSVSRMAMIKKQQDEAAQVRAKEIQANVDLRNERIAAQNAQKLEEQRKREAQQRAVRERREQLEREQLERLRAENGQQAVRENYMYQNNQNAEGRDR